MDRMSKQVGLVPYDPSFPDESVLWSESKDLGDGFLCIRKIDDISMNFDAFHGDKDHGGVRDGTVVMLYEWYKKSMNQRWKIVPYGRIIPNVNELIFLTLLFPIEKPTKCRLAVSLDSKIVVVRHGMVHPASPGDQCHTQQILADRVKVRIVAVQPIHEGTPLQVPTKHHITIREALCSFVQ